MCVGGGGGSVRKLQEKLQGKQRPRRCSGRASVLCPGSRVDSRQMTDCHSVFIFFHFFIVCVCFHNSFSYSILFLPLRMFSPVLFHLISSCMFSLIQLCVFMRETDRERQRKKNKKGEEMERELSISHYAFFHHRHIIRSLRVSVCSSTSLCLVNGGGIDL